MVRDKVRDKAACSGANKVELGGMRQWVVIRSQPALRSHKQRRTGAPLSLGRRSHAERRLGASTEEKACLLEHFYDFPHPSNLEKYVRSSQKKNVPLVGVLFGLSAVSSRFSPWAKTTVRSRAAARRRRRGEAFTFFTLIELLVVIAILAILAAMLLPALGRAQESGKRIVCLNNQRQISVGMTLFAFDHTRRYPLVADDYKQFNYTIYHAANDRIYGIGSLYRDDILSDPAIFYCPSQENSQFQFDTSSNPWPPGDQPTHTRAAFGVRPIGNINALTTAEYNSHDYTKFPRPGKDFESNSAIIADLSRHKVDLVNTHRGEGLNVIRADGSGAWRRASGSNWAPLLLTVTGAHSTSYNPVMDEIWLEFDE